MTVKQLQAKGVRILRIVYADLYGIQRGAGIDPDKARPRKRFDAALPAR